MSAWAIASLVGALFAGLILVLLVVVSRAAARTAANAEEILVALEEVRARTQALADLDGRTQAVVRDAASALQGVQGVGRHEDAGIDGDGHEPDGR